MSNRSDNFDRTDSTSSLGTPSDGGSAWVVASGTWGISSNRGYKFASSGNFQIAYLEASTSSADVQATFPLLTSSGPVVRAADNNNFIMGQASDSANQAYIYKRVSGTFTQLGSTYSGAVADGDVLKITVNASNSLSLYQNGVLRVGPTTDSAGSTNTKHGLMLYDTDERVDDFSITDTASAGSTVTPGAGALTLTGYAPTAGITQSAATSLGALTITGYAPTVTATSGQTISVDTGALTLTGYAPTAGVTYSTAPDVGSLTITGYAPTVDVTAEGEVRIPAGELILTGYAPTVVVPIIIGIDQGFLTLTGYAPEVVNSGDVVAPVAGQQPAGKSRKPRKKRYQVEIEGEVFEVSSAAEAEEVLEQAKKDAEATAKLAVERAAKAKQRPARKVIQDARKALELPAIAAPAFPALVDEVNAQIERIYQDALNSVEIALLLRQREREDEDDEEILLLL